MRRTIRKTLTLVLIMLFALCTLFAFVGFPKSVNAEEEPTTPDTANVFAMDYGAYARVKATAEDFGGLRFRVKFGENVKARLDGTDELAFTVMTKDYYDGISNKDSFEYGAEAINAVDGIWQVAVDKAKIYQGRDAYSDDVYYFANCLIKAGESYYGTEFVAIANVYDGEVYQYATYEESQITKSLYGVVNSAVLNGQAQDIAATYEWFGDEDFPIVISDNTEYEKLANQINGGENFFKDKKFNISSDVVVKKEDFTGFSDDEFNAFAENSDIPTYTVKYVVETSAGSGVYEQDGELSSITTNSPSSLISSLIKTIEGKLYEEYDVVGEIITLKYAPAEKYTYSVKFFKESSLDAYTEDTTLVAEDVISTKPANKIADVLKDVEGYSYYGYKVDDANKTLSIYYIPSDKYATFSASNKGTFALLNDGQAITDINGISSNTGRMYKGLANDPFLRYISVNGHTSWANGDMLLMSVMATNNGGNANIKGLQFTKSHGTYGEACVFYDKDFKKVESANLADGVWYYAISTFDEIAKVDYDKGVIWYSPCGNNTELYIGKSYVLGDAEKDKFIPGENYTVNYFVENGLDSYEAYTDITSKQVKTDNPASAISTLKETIENYSYYGYKIDSDNKVISLYYIPSDKYVALSSTTDTSRALFNKGQAITDINGISSNTGIMYKGIVNTDSRFLRTIGVSGRTSWANGEMLLLTVKATESDNANIKGLLYVTNNGWANSCAFYDKDFNKVKNADLVDGVWYYAIATFDAVDTIAYNKGVLYYNAYGNGSELYIGKSYLISDSELVKLCGFLNLASYTDLTGNDIIINRKGTAPTAGEGFKVNKTNMDSGIYKDDALNNVYYVNTTTSGVNTCCVGVCTKTPKDYVVFKVYVKTGEDASKLNGQTYGANSSSAYVTRPTTFYDMDFNKLNSAETGKWMYAVIDTTNVMENTANYNYLCLGTNGKLDTSVAGEEIFVAEIGTIYASTFAAVFGN